ncbi:uncharacterized protein G2W53_017363 [Senna tora]|uniref:Uncharacterized protein n=1 Tax=Senna tora TaxID=362788 RepID=A0A834TYA0_9FABA|nr:uncharacterized protein G2W53_017363 [Senna tora]
MEGWAAGFTEASRCACHDEDRESNGGMASNVTERG